MYCLIPLTTPYSLQPLVLQLVRLHFQVRNGLFWCLLRVFGTAIACFPAYLAFIAVSQTQNFLALAISNYLNQNPQSR